MNSIAVDPIEKRAGHERHGRSATRQPWAPYSRRIRPWRHPFKPHIKVPYYVAVAIAVMEMGISDYTVIAYATGLTVEEVERIDMVEDPAVRRLALARIPLGETFRLANRVRCPKCQAKVGLAPCIACRGR
ncbi:MAG: hypothetical protein JW818_01965 [Pirellulales bacterium]|nr:hypothetical protein [Pirellulales bacterium]